MCSLKNLLDRRAMMMIPAQPSARDASIIVFAKHVEGTLLVNVKARLLFNFIEWYRMLNFKLH